jgi:DNA-binding MarR family transcriptional regulator
MAQGGNPRTGASQARVEYGVLPDLVGFNLRIAYGLASQLFSVRFASMDLAPIQFAALEFISRTGGLSQTEIAEHVGTAPTVLVTPLERMESRGLIERGRDPADRRRAVVWITEAGKALLSSARAEITAVEDELLAPLDPWEREQLLEFLQKVARR